MKPRIVSELKEGNINHLLESLRSSGDTFTEWPKNMLDKFRDNFKFLTFTNKQQLTKRGEPVDFIGCIVDGSANVIMEHKSYAVLKKGEFIGYMNLIGMQGTEVQQFDIYGKEAGCLALLKREDLRLLSRKEPELCHYLYKTITLKNLNTISHQYFDRDYQIKKIHATHTITNKKLILQLDGLGLTQIEVEAMNKSSFHKKQPSNVIQSQSFRIYWNQLDERDKRLFVQLSNTVQLGSQQELIRNGQRGNFIFIVLDGELVSVGGLKNLSPTPSTLNHVYRVGDAIGLKEFHTEGIYMETVEARTKCLLLRISKQNLQDMFNISPISASNILCMLTRYESNKIREQFDNNHHHDRINLQQQVEHLVEKLKDHNQAPIAKKDQQSIPQLMTNYFELDIKKSDLLLMDFNDKHAIQDNAVASLYVLDRFKDLIAKRGFQSNEIKDVRDPMVITGLSWFMRGKAHEQNLQNLKDKEETKRLRKGGKSKVVVVEQDLSESFDQKDIFDDMSDENESLKAELKKTHEYILLLEQGMHQLKEQHKSKSDDHQKLNSQLKKHEMHRQLLKLDTDGDQIIISKNPKQIVTFFDTFKQQASDARRFQSTIHAADKLINRKPHI